MNKDFLKITDYEVLGKLPNPFVFEDGTEVKTKEDWEKRKKEFSKSVIELQYGQIPPEPEFLEVEPLSERFSKSCNYRVVTGRKEHPVSFVLNLKLPYEFNDVSEGKFPFVISGDLCWNYWFNKEMINAFTNENIALALFNRTELAPDRISEGKNGQLYKAYPEYEFGAIAAWAWGYMRCVDALIKIGIVDEKHIVFTGHSRGAKTAALAGALDERAFIVHANETCAGACGCYRVHMSAVAEDGKEYPSEQLHNLLRYFPFWMGKDLAAYADCEEKLPFDAHYLKAMIAPRIYFDAQATSDIWGNPIGAWQTNMAVKEVYDFLGAPENLYWYYREGFHGYEKSDIDKLIAIINHEIKGTDLGDGFFTTPFHEPELIFDWRNPNK